MGLKLFIGIGSLIASSAAFAQEPKPYLYSAKNEQVQLRHIEGKGIGYDEGYTTLQAFFSPVLDHFIPMLDFRGHVFDNGKFAINTGIGLRCLTSHVYGINMYYDYRQTHAFHYNQFSFGLESLGKWVDLRLNGYFPVGRKQGAAPRLNALGDHKHSHREFALKGGNAEMGMHLLKSHWFELYAAAGPYYFEGRETHAWGGEGRVSLTFFDHVRFEVNGSYDPVFKGIAQGQLSLMYFFGPKVELKNRQARPNAIALRERATQWIDRFEIIVVDEDGN